MARKSKKVVLDHIEEKTRDYLAILEKYPYQDIAEYTRCVEAIENFLRWGLWSRHIEDKK